MADLLGVADHDLSRVRRVSAMPSRITLELPALAVSGGTSLRRRAGETFHCRPSSVRTVTVFFVVARQHTFDLCLPRRLEGDPVADLELQHIQMRPHLMEEAETRDDAVIEVDELRFGQLVDVDLHPKPAAEGWESQFQLVVAMLDNFTLLVCP